MQLSETEMMLKGYGLTTAEFFYRMPDYTHVLNSFIWQDYDTAPDHPRLFEFVEFWQGEIEGAAAFGAFYPSQADCAGGMAQPGR